MSNKFVVTLADDHAVFYAMNNYAQQELINNPQTSLSNEKYRIESVLTKFIHPYEKYISIEFDLDTGEARVLTL